MDFERPSIEVVEISDDKKYGRFVVVMASRWEIPSAGSCSLHFPALR